MGNKIGVMAKLFNNPDMPTIDDYYEPFTFDYEHLQNAPQSKHQPIARPRSLITGQRMDKVEKGPNWEEILGENSQNALLIRISMTCKKRCMVSLKIRS